MRQISVLITGASGDIGLALYEKLYARPEYEFYLHFRNKKSYERVRPRIRTERTNVLLADFSKPAQVDRMAKALPKIDLLINNAGVFEAGSFYDTPYSEIEKSLRVNFLAPLQLVHHVAGTMRKSGGGKIINLSSGSANHTGLLPSFGYASGKNGVNFMTQALSKELGPDDVVIVAVVLRFIQTKMLDVYSANYRKFTGKGLDVNQIGSDMTVHTPQAIAQKVSDIIDNPRVASGDIIEIL